MSEAIVVLLTAPFWIVCCEMCARTLFVLACLWLPKEQVDDNPEPLEPDEDFPEATKGSDEDELLPFHI